MSSRETYHEAIRRLLWLRRKRMRLLIVLMTALQCACHGGARRELERGATTPGNRAEQPTRAVSNSPRQAAAPSPDTLPPILTDRTLYVMRRDTGSVVYRAEARVTYTNRRSTPVYVEACRRNQPNFQVGNVGPRMRDVALLPGCPLLGGIPRIRIGPGESRTDLLTLSTPHRTLLAEGPFRFVVGVYADARGTTKLPRMNGWSNPFSVRLED